jgi:hypothetical protein
MRIISHTHCLQGIVEKEELPIRILAVASRTPVLIYNKYQSFDDNIVRILIEYGLSREEALKNYNQYTLVGSLMDRSYVDGRDYPQIIDMCDLTNYKKINLLIKKYTDDEMRQRESRKSILQH